MLLDFGLFSRRHSPSRSRESCSFVARTAHGTLNWSHTGSQFVFNALTNSMTTCQLFTLTKSALILQLDCFRKRHREPMLESSDRPTWSDPADGRNKSGHFFLSGPFQSVPSCIESKQLGRTRGQQAMNP
jgi:hypothetical protein